MIIWRGWGILAILVPGLMCALLTGVLQALGRPPSTGNEWVVGVGLLLGGVLTFVLGHWLNTVRPQAELATYQAALRQDLWERVRAGAFQAGPGVPPPSTQQEAQMQVEQVVLAQSGEAARRLRNRHTLFFIPMQWVGVGVATIGVFAFVGMLLS